MPNLLKKLRKENNLLDQQLSQENYKIMADIVCYLRLSNLCDYDLEIIRKDLTGMLLEAQLRNEKCSDVFGDDYRSMCDELIKNGIQKTMYRKLLEILNVLIFSIGVIYICEIIFSSKIIFIAMSCQFTILITGLVIATLCTLGIAFCIYYYIAKSSIQLSIHNRIIQVLFIIGLLLGWAVTVLIRALAGNLIVYNISCFLPAVFLIIALIVVKYLIYQYDNKSLEVLINRDTSKQPITPL